MKFTQALLITALAQLVMAPASAEPQFDAARVDAVVARAMARYDVPGVALGIVSNGVVVYAQGYGVRELGKPETIDTETLFKIASNSKAFTAASLALLVDAGELRWDDPVADHLKDFRLHDPWVTREFNVIDLLTHRSGLAPFVGDMMLWPEPNDFSRADIIHNLRYFEPTSSFRSRYAYDNLLYIVAGEIVPAVTGQSWDDFVDTKLMQAMGARRCFAGSIGRRQLRNLAAPHGVIEGELQVIERSRITPEPVTSMAAGGIRCSLQDMLTWVQVQLDGGELPTGERLYSEAQAEMMWNPVTLLGVSDAAAERDRTHFRAYALGWRLADVHGYLEVSHTGTLSGWNSYAVMIPELELGAVVLTNGSSGRARRALMYELVRPYLGIDDTDWIEYVDAEAERFDRDKETSTETSCEVCPTGEVLAPLSAYAGVYRDRWFGEITVAEDDAGLTIAAARSPRLQGRLEPYAGNTFIARWTDRTLEGDAFVTFSGDTPATIDRMSMRAVSERSDFDFGDMQLERAGAD